MTFTSRTVDSTGVRLATRDYGGDGAPLVLMHGAGMTQGSLEPLVAELAARHRVVTFDFRGHGGTDVAPWTFAASVQDVGAVAEAYGLGVPAVGGHSLGGMVAAAYAREHPSCPGAINIDGHGLGRPEQYVGYDEAEVRLWWDGHRRRIERLTSQPVAAVLTGLSFLLRRTPAAGTGTVRQVQQEVDATDLFAWYRQVRCPLLVFNATAEENRAALKLLVGKGRPLLRAYRQGLGADLATLASEQSNVRVVQLDATHMLITTHAAEVARPIEELLS